MASSLGRTVGGFFFFFSFPFFLLFLFFSVKVHTVPIAAEQNPELFEAELIERVGVFLFIEYIQAPEMTAKKKRESDEINTFHRDLEKGAEVCSHVYPPCISDSVIP